MTVNRGKKNVCRRGRGRGGGAIHYFGPLVNPRDEESTSWNDAQERIDLMALETEKKELEKKKRTNLRRKKVKKILYLTTQSPTTPERIPGTLQTTQRLHYATVENREGERQDPHNSECYSASTAACTGYQKKSEED